MKVLKCEIILRKNVNTLNRRRTIGASASNTIREIKTFKKRVMMGKKNKTFFYRLFWTQNVYTMQQR